MERSRRSNTPLSIAMIDVDYFKRINDELGHQVGNQALEKLAEILVDNVRKIDFACRYGGEEFTLILPGVRLPPAVRVAERLSESVENAPLRVTDESGEEREVTITASVGVDEYRSDDVLSPQEFLERADRYLLKAKADGRNRVCHSLEARRDGSRGLNREERKALRL